MSCHVSTHAQVRFWPEVIYFISIQVHIISHKLDSSHFSTSKIFLNNLVPGRHWTPITPKNVKTRLSRNSIKFVWVTRFRETNPMVGSISSSEIWKISRISTYTILAIYCFVIFQKNSIVLRFYSYELVYVSWQCTHFLKEYEASSCLEVIHRV